MKLSLSDWHAQPMTADEALRLQQRARAEQAAALRRHGRCADCDIVMMIADFWLGKDIGRTLQTLLATADSPRSTALLHLVYGQLLISRKLSGAMAALQQGLRLAADLLSATEYLQLVRRHQLLSCLPLQQTPSPAAGLAQLLTEARVIQKLKSGHSTEPPTRDSSDTLG